MKKNILKTLALAVGLCFAACSDDEDYTVATAPLLKEGAVVTGSADVTSTSAVMHGTVAGLEGQAAGAYVTGFYYGTAAENLSERVLGNSGAEFSAAISGMPGSAYYYQAFVSLQGKLTYRGEVKSLVLTDAKAVTGAASGVTANSAALAASLSNVPDKAEAGIVISGVEGTERVRAGYRLVGDLAADFSVDALGLMPGTTYYYAAYIDLGLGIVYGDTKEFTTPAKPFDVDADMVDLGLSTKWAKCNLGAASENELGGLLAFGDLAGFNTSIDPADYAAGNIYKTASDVVNVVSDGKATIPTIAEYEELFRCCTVEWTEEEGVSGYKFTGPNGNSIFMPAAGSRVKGAVSGVGAEGRYLSGSIATGNTSFAMSYYFTQSANGRTTTPVYQALSVRPVSVAKNVPFDASLLYNTWEIDLDVDGSYQVFKGPSYFYGTDDSWRTVTNNEPVVGDSWLWDPDFAGNSWVVGGSADNCRGAITFSEDGVVIVKRVNAEGTETTDTGTYVIDTEKKEITMTINCLAPSNYGPGFVDDLQNNIRILSLTDKSLQLGVMRTDPSQGPCLLSINMIPALEKYGYAAKLTCYGAAVGGGEQGDAWASAVKKIPGKDGSHVLTFTTAEPRTNGMVYVIDIEDFAKVYPNAFVRIDSIKADGVAVPFDANKFFYGDIENNGTFRVELANIWGRGHNDGWDGLKDTPFQAEGGETTNETALAFNSTFEVGFTVFTEADLNFTVKQTAVGLNADWSMPGNWAKDNIAAISVKLEDNKYVLASTADLSVTLNADECSDGVPANGAVNLLDVVGVRKYFPGFAADLISVTNDGADVPFDASKLKTGDIEDNGNFRIELHNIWGSGTAADPAFEGATVVEGNNVVTALGFANSSTYTIGNFAPLFINPWE